MPQPAWHFTVLAAEHELTSTEHPLTSVSPTSVHFTGTVSSSTMDGSAQPVSFECVQAKSLVFAPNNALVSIGSGSSISSFADSISSKSSSSTSSRASVPTSPAYSGCSSV